MFIICLLTDERILCTDGWFWPLNFELYLFFEFHAYDRKIKLVNVDLSHYEWHEK